MLYAKVVLGLPIDGPFDYLVQPDMANKISVGARVWVNFRNKKEVAYVVGLSSKTRIKKIKEISTLIDTAPVLDKKMLLLTRGLAEYYCCSWGEAIETALPDELRKGREVARGWVGDDKEDEIGLVRTDPALPRAFRPRSLLLPVTPGNDVHFVQGLDRMQVYLREIKEAWALKRSAIILFSDIPEAEKAKELIEKELGTEVSLAFRKQPKELKVWEGIRQQQCSIVVGTRSSIFSPVNNLGLIIVDQEQNQVYKQEQVPHYHARQVALMRAKICGAKAVLGGCVPSLESFYLGQKDKLKFEVVPAKTAYPQVKVIDARRLPYRDRKNKPIFSKFLSDAIYTTLTEKGKLLLFIERKGFATSAACHNCGVALKCPRCNINLVFHFDEDRLKCHHCNFKMEVPKICPSCNTGYIKYSGIGTEKVESELAKVFPQARVKIFGGENKPGLNPDADVFVATSSVIKHQDLSFDLIGVMAIDNSLNRVDFRAAEKTFALLMGLASLTSKKMIIQSVNVSHHCFQALIKNDQQIFLKEELRQRKQLNLAPYRHMVLIKLRGINSEAVKKAARDLFERLSQVNAPGVKMLSLSTGQPPKLRGNFYYQILISASSAEKASRFLRLHLKEGHYSGIIVTVDVDPV
ncbi:MAG: primosomal protein N' [Candidatus Omnitrophica bacterium]|nr:primosomal protein N' [Candidatus Omnitrophota bacterium]